MIAALLIGGVWPVPALAGDDEAVKKAMIQESIRHYPGNCPCPYSVNRAGRACGKSSAYLKPGGKAPLCYPRDITQEMLDAYKRQTRTRR